MVLEPTNWRANAEQPACRETGRGTAELRACGLGGVSQASEGQASDWSSCICPPWLGDLGQAS